MLEIDIGQMASDLIGTGMTNRARRKLAEKQMDFQERMSNTSYQRLVKDLDKAGLSKVLALGGSGASTPQGAMATLENPFQNVVNNAATMRRLQHEVENVDADTRQKEQLTDESMQKMYTEMTVQLMNEGKTAKEAQEVVESKRRVDKIDREIDKVKREIELIREKKKLTKSQAEKERYDLQMRKLRSRAYRWLNDVIDKVKKGGIDEYMRYEKEKLEQYKDELKIK